MLDSIPPGDLRGAPVHLCVRFLGRRSRRPSTSGEVDAIALCCERRDNKAQEEQDGRTRQWEVGGMKNHLEGKGGGGCGMKEVEEEGMKEMKV